MEPIFGIDLGTTNSCVATIGYDDLPVVIKNLEELNTTPSVVYYEDTGENFVGVEAKRSMEVDPARTVAFIKRQLSKENYRVNIDGNDVSPVDVSALILKKVFDDANEQRSYDGLPPIKKAVITVPAYFGNMECELTKQAARIAGIEVLDLLNEPTAAALSYGTKGLEGKTFMIYDLGGGTFDVSIMRMTNGVLDTLSTDGDHHLGGVDWDKALADFGLLKAGYDFSYDDIKDEPDGGKLLNAAENCKKTLSKNDTAKLKIMRRRKQTIVDVTRSQFEELTEELLDKTMNIVRHAIEISRDKNAKIDEIILIGGSSYMPMVKKRLQQEFSCPIRLDNLEPDLAVAKGAAIHAANLMGSDKTDVKIGNDLGSRSYGILCSNETEHGIRTFVANVIKRTDNLIFEGTSEFSTLYEDQQGVHISVYENNLIDNQIEDVDSCTLVGSKDINWGFPVPKGTPVTAHVSRSSDGTVKIWVECQDKRADFEIKYVGMYSEAELQQKQNALRHKIV